MIGRLGSILSRMNMRVSIPGLVGLVALSFVASSIAEGVYKWEDEDGQMHFSDMPREGAVEVDLAPVQTFSSSVDARTANTDAGGADNEADSAGYKSLEISSPSQEETIWNTGGAVTVKLNLSPSLEKGHSVRLYMDGQPMADLPPRATSVQLSEVVRGTHTLSAEVRDSNDQVLIKSSPVTFFYKQTSADARRIPAPARPTPNRRIVP